MENQTLAEAIEKAKQTIKRFEGIEGKPWGIEGAVIELAKQVGQLSALVMNREGYYFPSREEDDSKYVSSNKEIADELADIMLALVRVANHYEIDLAGEIQKTRQAEDEFLRDKGV